MCPYFRVGHILAKKKKSPQSPLDRCWAFFSWGCWNKLRPYNFSVSRMFWVPLIFLAAYYFLQCHYQFDWGFLCPEGIWNETCKTYTNKSMPLRGFQPKDQHTECCRKWTKVKYEEWGKRATSLTSIITFLLGFYVSRIVVTWWSRVASIPDIENSLLMLAGLVSSNNPKFQLPADEDQTQSNGETKVKSTQFPIGVLEAKKMIARYGLLSWTLCFSTISPSFKRNFKTLEQLKDKGLLKEREKCEVMVRK